MDQRRTLSDTTDRLYAKAGRNLKIFTDEVYAKEASLAPTFTSFGLALDENCGPLTGQRDHDLVRQRVNRLVEVQSQIVNFRDEVIIPVQDSLACIENSSPTIPPFKLRFDLLFYRCRFITLDEGLRTFSYLQKQQNEREDPVDHITVICQALKIKIATESIGNIMKIGSKITECDTLNLKRLEVEFRLLQMHFFMIAKAFGVKEVDVAFDFLASLKRVTELCDEYPHTAAMFLQLASDLSGFYRGGKAPNRYKEWNTEEIKALSVSWGEHEIGHLKTCQYKHPYSSKTFKNCPECGQETSRTAANPINYDSYLMNDATAFMAAFKKVQLGKYGTPKGKQ